MSALVAPLVLGAVAAAAALAFVLFPLLVGSSGSRAGSRAAGLGIGGTAPGEDSARAIDALREIEFDRETGKLSDSDYAALKATYTAAAVAELRGEERGGARAGRTGATVICPTCGPRPEAEALFCSNCARYLPGNCVACGAPVAEPAARYCAGCGNRLVA
jgi:hypothetical protein